MVSKSGSPGPAPTSVTQPSAWPDACAPAKADGSEIFFSAASASSPRPASTSAPIGPSTTRSQKRRRSGISGMRLWSCLRQRPMKAGEIADPRRQHRLDAFAHAARHHRRCAAGADRDHHVTAIDDRGKNEARMRQVVHHIDRQADRLCPHRHRNSDVAGARAKNRNHTAEIGRQRIAFGNLDPRRVGRLQSADIMIAIGREPANARAGRSQQRNFARARSPAPTSSTGPVCRSRNTGRNRIRYSLPRLTGLTGIIFYICLIRRPQRENYFFSIALQL